MESDPKDNSTPPALLANKLRLKVMTPLRALVDQFEKELIMTTIHGCHSIAHAARVMCVNRTTLIEKMKKHGIRVSFQKRILVDKDKKEEKTT